MKRDGIESSLGVGRLAVRLGAAALALGLAVAGPAAAACAPASYCAQDGACIPIAEVERQALERFGPEGFDVTSVRLKGHAPSPTCLWYEVMLVHPAEGARVVYWNITGGQAG